MAWRARLAAAIRAASGARMSAVLTCPPGRVLEAQASAAPETFGGLIERLVLRFLPHIERGGEGWEAMTQLGSHPYAPLEHAGQLALAEQVRQEVLRPAGLSTLVNAFLLSSKGSLLGWIVVGDEATPDDLLMRCSPLGEVARSAADTLQAALDLAAACGGLAPLRADPRLAQLTPREGQVLRLLAAGLRDGEIAGRLGISEQTVGSHLRRVYEKLGVHSRAAAAARLARDRP